MQPILYRKLLTIVLLLILIFAVGTIGYMLIEGPHQSMTPFDAFYLTVITLTTIGFGEIPGELSTAGRVLTIVLAFGGMGTLLYGVSNITAFFVEGHLSDLLRKKRMEKEIKKMSKHFIVCGTGLVVRYIIEELMKTRNDFVIVNNDDEDLRKLTEEYPEVKFVAGDVSQDDVLINCGVERARGLLTAQSSDQDNLFTIITARRLNSSLRIISVAIAESSIAKLRYAGADGVISPNYIGSMRMVSEMIRPVAVSFLDVMLKDKKMNWRIEEAVVGKEGRIAGKSLGESNIRTKSKVLVLAVKKPGEQEYIYNPSADVEIEPGDTLVVLGTVDQIGELKRMASA